MKWINAIENAMLVTKMLKNAEKMLKNAEKLSPASKTCQQLILYPASVTNIKFRPVGSMIPGYNQEILTLNSRRALMTTMSKLQT